MVNYAKEITKASGRIDDTLAWAGTMNNNLKAAIVELKKLLLNITDKSYYQEAKAHLRNARRCQRRIARYYGDIQEVLMDKKFISMLPVDLKQRLAKIQAILRPHEAELIVETSFIRGKSKEQLKDIGVQLDLLHQNKIENDRALRDLIKSYINDLEKLRAEKIKNASVGLVPFMAAVQTDLTSFIEDLQSLIAA